MSSLKDLVAVVTGGSRGIGRAISLELAKRGAYVWINYGANQAAAEAVLAEIQAAGGQGALLPFDVASSTAVDEAFGRIKKEGPGKLDIVVNNAGISRDGLLMRFKNEDWDKTIATNLSGSFYVARASAKMLLRSTNGRIINISSVVGEMGNAGQSAYVASKSGVIGLTKTLARELATRNITVNAVTPGFIETDMTHALTPEVKEEHLKFIPLNRYGKAEEIAGLVAYLAEPQASYITGQIIGVNGGMYM